MALGRLRGGGACADRRGAAAGAAQPLCRNRRELGAPAPMSRTNAGRSRPRASDFQAAGHTEARNARARTRPQPPGGAAVGADRGAHAADRQPRRGDRRQNRRPSAALAALAPAAELESKLASGARRHRGQARRRSPRCAPSSRRSCARPNWPTGAWPRSPPTRPAGSSAATAPAIRSPRLSSASRKPSATVPSLKTRRRFSPKSARR